MDSAFRRDEKFNVKNGQSQCRGARHNEERKYNNI